MEIDRQKKSVKLLNELTLNWFNYISWLLVIAMIRVITILAEDPISLYFSWIIYVISILLVLVYFSVNLPTLIGLKKFTWLKIIMTLLIVSIIALIYGFITSLFSNLFVYHLFLNK
jgi:hypothetical protein